MQLVPHEKITKIGPLRNLICAWHDECYIAQLNRVLMSNQSYHRLSIRRKDGRDGITWDELQRVKNACGYDNRCAVELYPATDDVMNTFNARHLFIMDRAPDFMFTVRDPENMAKQNGMKDLAEAVA